MSGPAPEGSVKLEEKAVPRWVCQRFQGGGSLELSLEGKWDLVRLRSGGG